MNRQRGSIAVASPGAQGKADAGGVDRVCGTFAAVAFVITLVCAVWAHERAEPFLWFGGTIVVLCIFLMTGHKISKLVFAKDHAEVVTHLHVEAATVLVPAPEPLVTEEQRNQRRRQFRARPSPGMRLGVRPFQLLDDVAAVRPISGTDPTLPFYRLDRNFRILDWNDAFSLAFDGTLEGRRGQNAQEWVFFLDNYEEVMQHGAKMFGNPDSIPRFDCEVLHYTSSRYGPIEASKRAYQLPAENDTVDSWGCVLDLKFKDAEKALQYQRDLITVMRDDLMWSEYAVSYDRVLANTEVYAELIDEVLGETGGEDGLEPVAADANVLDLGAGTGNITLRLAEGSDRRSIVALDKNRFMLGALRSKCQQYLRTERNQPGVVAIKQDITNLYGLPDNHFDVAILNNVLYAVGDPKRCLREVYRVLKPGGEIRLTGPKQNTDLDKLFERIKADLTDAGKWKEVADDYARVEQINRYRLRDLLYRYTSSDVEEMLREAGFDGDPKGRRIWRRDDVYAGQAMLLRAFKPANG
ncbi:MAG TPA: class I SAM-dependent methyltransferase [Burkholderiales bacterium]|nr:class I SAM-dependent methyltransferase [Burkholderiales bacterium]